MAGSNVKLREYLAKKSIIDCDTLNPDVPPELGPFHDCTSNQAILCAELAHDKHRDLIKKCISTAREIKSIFPDVRHEELTLDLCALAVQQQIAPNISGYVHLQVNPFNAYSASKIIANAKRFVSLCDHLSPNFDSKRLCIKIPSTYEGLTACKSLEASGIRTLATTLFSMEQAALAAEAGCLYIAPYVLELRVHIEPGYIDPDPAYAVCHQAQLYYRHHGFKTKVLAASLTSIEQLTRLAGVDHMTISQPLLEALTAAAAVVAEDDKEVLSGRSIFKTFDTDALPEEHKQRWSWTVNEDEFRIAFTRRDRGRAEWKQIYAINTFCDMQIALEQMIREV